MSRPGVRVGKVQSYRNPALPPATEPALPYLDPLLEPHARALKDFDQVLERVLKVEHLDLEDSGRTQRIELLERHLLDAVRVAVYRALGVREFSPDPVHGSASHECAPSVGSVEVGPSPVIGAVDASTSPADVPTVGVPTDSPAGSPSPASPSVAGPAGGDTPPSPPAGTR